MAAAASLVVTMLQVVATSIMTATTSTFSLTVVALQPASQQFSPRVQREFARDTETQVVLATLISTFVISSTGLRGMGSEAPLPVLVPALVMVMGLASVGALVMFLGHIVRSLRVDSMMVAVHQEAAATVARAYPDYDDHSKDPAPGLPGPQGGTLLRSDRSGFVQAVRPGVPVEGCAEHGVPFLLGVRPGDQRPDHRRSRDRLLHRPHRPAAAPQPRSPPAPRRRFPRPGRGDPLRLFR
ncbi:DUF2254 family protein [Kocuria sp. CPCC 205263]|uniref:DUF2254 family protein n=1 Tax=Kocuria sp. CPCC 205263 TaxID=3073555 RepID=UPI0034D3F071